MAPLPANISIGQPSRTGWTTCCSACAHRSRGDDLDTLRSLAEELRQRQSAIHVLVDLQVEKQVLIPQQQVRIDCSRAAHWVSRQRY